MLATRLRERKATAHPARPNNMKNFPRPDTPTVTAPREQVSGTCPHCNSTTLQRYRVMSEGGWWMVLKCQGCLRSLEREPGPLLGPLVPLADSLNLAEG
jgi:hypothetical protein